MRRSLSLYNHFHYDNQRVAVCPFPWIWKYVIQTAKFRPRREKEGSFVTGTLPRRLWWGCRRYNQLTISTINVYIRNNIPRVTLMVAMLLQGEFRLQPSFRSAWVIRFNNSYCGCVNISRHRQSNKVLSHSDIRHRHGTGSSSVATAKSLNTDDGDD